MSDAQGTSVHNERTKLLATAFNNLAIAFAVAGFVAPAASGQIDGAGRLIVGVAWLIVSAGFLSLAQAIPGGLR